MKKTIYFLMYDKDIVHGGFFDTFEYYYIVKKVFKDCNVKWRCITSYSRDSVLAVLNEKYEGIEQKAFDDIEVIPHRYGVLYRNPLRMDLIVCPTNSAIYWFLEGGSIQAAKAYIGMSDWPNINPKQNKYYPNHYVLADERVYDYGDTCNWKPYRKKILFDKFKHDDRSYGKHDYMLNLSLAERRFSKEWMMELFNHFGYGHVSFVAYVGLKNREYYSWLKDLDLVYVVEPPLDDFMGLFRTFIYTPYSNGMDATPRLIPECAYYEKGIEYYDKDISIKSGGYYRYQDTMISDNFEGLWLKEDDEVMEYIDKCLSL